MRQGGTDENEAIIGSPSPSLPSPSVDELKLACLPRLAREQEVRSNGESSTSRCRTLSDRLYQMRIEDGRRQRNQSLAQQRESGSKQSGTISTVQTLPHYTSSSASARAGSLYHQSSQLALQDNAKRQELGELRRKFAGPTPPESWRKEEVEGSAESALGLQDDVVFDHLARKRSTTALRYFTDGTTASRELPSLTDVCLLCMVSSFRDTSDSAVLAIRDKVDYVPFHLKDRIMALAGREQLCQPLNDSAVQCLLRDVDEDRYGNGLDSWDSNEDDKCRSLASYTVLDLSFASINSRALRSVLSRCSGMRQLTSLSLAGWGYDDHAGQKSLLTIYALMETIGKLTHLELLSLAHSRLCPLTRRDALRTKESKMLESMTFLKRLSRASLRLKVLDLSECHWIEGPDIANLGWYSVDEVATRSKIIWPRLEHLVLVNCSAFQESGTFSSLPSMLPSATYVGRWHAAHHGLPPTTDSPYLLDHRPGLGQAIFRVNDAHTRQERHARQRRDRRTSADADNGAWGSSEEGGEERDEHRAALHSASSSGYPTRCPVSGIRVGAWEWERARVLDAVRGRWGSAVKRSMTMGTTPTRAARGHFIEIYF